MAYNETPTESNAMENPFARLVTAAEELVTDTIEILDMEDTPQNRNAIANQLYNAAKGETEAIGGDLPFSTTMYLIALSTLRMQYSRECVEIAMQN